MGTRLYVGNLSYDTTADQLKELFSASGVVASADLVMDRQTGRSKGFAFIEMGSEEAAAAAISALNETELDGRKLNVNEAKPREERTSSNNRSYGGGYGSKRY
ncbi:MAG: RNA-binding protein [Actinomycetota bacterium]